MPVSRIVELALAQGYVVEMSSACISEDTVC